VRAFLNNWKRESKEAEKDILDPPLAEVPAMGQEMINDIVYGDTKTPLIEKPSQPIPTPKVKITKFDLAVPDFKKKDGNGKSTVLIASSRGGKTTLMNHIILKWFDNKDVITTLMCPSLNAGVYKDIRKAKNIIKTDMYLGQLIKDTTKIQRHCDNKYNFAYFIDDVIDEKGSEELLKAFLTYRNLNISTCINIQDTKLLSRPIRHNANNFLFLRLNTQDAIMDVLDLFLNSYEPFNTTTDKIAKVNMYRELTKDNHFIYLNALEDVITFHKPV
jgi:hypothetical protein